MDSFDDLLAHWTPAELSEDLCVPYHTAASMKRRGWVAATHWAALMQSARKKSLPVAEEMLIRFGDKRKREQERAA
jgi:hypothetical protein